MKIAVDARPLCQGLNGISRYLSSLLPLLSDSDDQWLLYADRALPEAVTDTLDKNVNWRCGDVQRRGLSTPFAQTLFPGWAKEDGVDMFWSPRHHLPLALKTPLMMVTIHDLVWQKVPQTMMRLGQLTERLLMPPALRMANAILAVSQATAADLRQYYPDVADKVYVTPLASALGGGRVEVSPMSAAQSPNILMVGSLEPRKNVPRVLDAFSRLRAEFADATLTLAGGGGWKSQALHDRLQTMRGQGVEYLGAVDDDKLTQLYQRARFVVAPSLYEGCGLPVLEAFAFGKPVVTANLSSMPEVAGAGGLLVDPGDTTQIHQAMRTLLTDADVYQQLRIGAIEQNKQFSWQKTAHTTRKVIEGLIRSQN